MGIFQVGVILGRNFPGGNCSGGSYPEWEFFGWELSGWSYPGWEFSLVGLFRVGIVRGNHLDENFRGGSFPSTNSFIFNSNLLRILIMFKLFS